MKLNRFVALFCISLSLPAFSQIGTGGFKINDNGEPMNEVLLSFDAIFDNTKVELTWSSDTEKKNTFYTIEKSKDAMNFDAVYCKLNRKRRGMRATRFTDDGFIRDEPIIASAPQIPSPRVRPSFNIRLMRIWYPDAKPIQWSVAGTSKVKNVFMAVVYKTFRLDRLKVANR